MQTSSLWVVKMYTTWIIIVLKNVVVQKYKTDHILNLDRSIYYTRTIFTY